MVCFKNSISWKKASNSALNSNNHTSTFSQHNLHATGCSRSALGIFPISSHTIFKRHAQESRFNKINFYAASSSTFLSGTGFFFFLFFLLNVLWWEVQWQQHVLMALSWFVQWHQQFYSPLLLHYQCKCDNSEKGK